jgi:aconitate hydratase
LPGVDRRSLKLTGEEVLDIQGLPALTPRCELEVVIHRPDGTLETLPVRCRIDTLDEVAYWRHGGILPYVLRGMVRGG